MDTRSKILTFEEALGRYTDYALILASFDVLTAARIHRLRRITAETSTRIAVVSEAPGSLLPLRARAELAASLAIIDCVIMLPKSLAAAPPQLLANASAVFDERELDQRHTAELIEHVQRRNRG